MSAKKHNVALCLSLLFAVFLWGGNNSGTKFLVTSWPPVWTGGSRFFCAGLLMLALLRWTRLLGRSTPLSAPLRRQLWWRGGLVLGAYIIAFNSALRFTSASHVALYLAASPLWALLWERPAARSWQTLRRYAAAGLALGGVLTLFWPALHSSVTDWRGEALGLTASVLWTLYGQQCRVLGQWLSGVETSAHTMWRAGLLLLLPGLWEVSRAGLTWRMDLVLVQVYCILAGGVAAFGIWATALRFWPTSRVLLFNNLIPLSTMSWAWVCLKEQVTSTFWLAMVLIIGGVLLGQFDWQKAFHNAAQGPKPSP